MQQTSGNRRRGSNASDGQLLDAKTAVRGFGERGGGGTGRAS